MQLSDKHKVLIHSTFNQVLSNDVTVKFYKHLFETYPELKPLFADTEMAKQRKMFIDMIQFIVYSMDNLEKVRTSIQQLIERHVSYGVGIDDYPKVVESFLWVLKDKLGDDYTDDVDYAWRTTFELILSVAEDKYDDERE